MAGEPESPSLRAQSPHEALRSSLKPALFSILSKPLSPAVQEDVRDYSVQTSGTKRKPLSVKDYSVLTPSLEPKLRQKQPVINSQDVMDKVNGTGEP